MKSLLRFEQQAEPSDHLNLARGSGGMALKAAAIAVAVDNLA